MAVYLLDNLSVIFAGPTTGKSFLQSAYPNSIVDYDDILKEQIPEYLKAQPWTKRNVESYKAEFDEWDKKRIDATMPVVEKVIADGKLLITNMIDRALLDAIPQNQLVKNSRYPADSGKMSLPIGFYRESPDDIHAVMAARMKSNPDGGHFVNSIRQVRNWTKGVKKFVEAEGLVQQMVYLQPGTYLSDVLKVSRNGKTFIDGPLASAKTKHSRDSAS